VVVLVTEFGRTARINGTGGADHGPGTLMLPLGGAPKGGRGVAAWPGVKPPHLLGNPGPRATLDARRRLKRVLKGPLRADDHALTADVFPRSDDVKPIAGLLASV